MLSEQEKMLMVGFLDNQLSEQEHAQASLLLKSSPEAVRLLDSLKADALALRQMGVPFVPSGLCQTINKQVLQHSRLQRFSGREMNLQMQAASTFLVAASVLILVVGVSYFSLNFLAPDGVVDPKQAQGNQVKDPVLAKAGPEQTEMAAKGLTKNNAIGSQEQGVATGLVGKDTITPDLKDKNLKDPSESPRIQNQNKDGLLAAPSQDRMELMKMETPFPLVLRGDDLQKATRRQFWNTTLKSEKSIRLEFIAKDPVALLRNLKVQLANAGFLSFSDVSTLRNIRNKSDKSLGGHLVFLELGQPEELGTLLDQESVKVLLDKGAKSSPGAGVALEGLVISRVTNADSKLLKSLVGVDLFDIKSDLRIATGDFKSRNSKNALVVSYSPGQTLASSTEVRQFLEARKKSSPENIRVLLVIRTET